MNPPLVLCCALLWSVFWATVNTYMLIENPGGSNQSSTIKLHLQNRTDLPQVIIEELSNTSKKLEDKSKKNRFKARVKRPPPPPNCVPLWGNCKTPNTVCCEYCAFCGLTWVIHNVEDFQ